jgi:hypothetical protein
VRDRISSNIIYCRGPEVEPGQYGPDRTRRRGRAGAIQTTRGWRRSRGRMAAVESGSMRVGCLKPTKARGPEAGDGGQRQLAVSRLIPGRVCQWLWKDEGGVAQSGQTVSLRTRAGWDRRDGAAVAGAGGETINGDEKSAGASNERGDGIGRPLQKGESTESMERDVGGLAERGLASQAGRDQD